MEVVLPNRTIYGYHIGSRKVVSYGDSFKICCVGVKPKYVA